MATTTGWWRTRTLDSGATAIGFMKMDLFIGWSMADVSTYLMEQLYKYVVVSDFVRVTP